MKLSENIDILKALKDEKSKQSYEKNTLQKEFETKKEAFQKADKTAFNTYHQLENVEDELENAEKAISDLKGDILLLQNKKSELERKYIQFTLNFEQENIKLNSYNQDLESS